MEVTFVQITRQRFTIEHNTKSMLLSMTAKCQLYGLATIADIRLPSLDILCAVADTGTVVQKGKDVKGIA